MKLTEAVEWGCAHSLVISAVGLFGSSTLLGMNLLVPNNHMPKSLEDAARRVAIASLVVGGVSVVGGTISELVEQRSRLEETLTQKLVQNHNLSRELKNYKFKVETTSNLQPLKVETVPRKEHIKALEARDREIYRRGQTIRQLRQELKEKNKSLVNWHTWWRSICDLDMEKYQAIGCRGCKHFEGSRHESVFFVCGMHPYGQVNCKDWED